MDVQKNMMNKYFKLLEKLTKKPTLNKDDKQDKKDLDKENNKISRKLNLIQDKINKLKGKAKLSKEDKEYEKLRSKFGGSERPNTRQMHLNITNSAYNRATNDIEARQTRLTDEMNELRLENRSINDRIRTLERTNRDGRNNEEIKKLNIEKDKNERIRLEKLQESRNLGTQNSQLSQQKIKSLLKTPRNRTE